MTSPSRRKAVDSPWEMRMLRTKVAKLIEEKFERCRACVKRRTVEAPNQDCAHFLESELPPSEYLAVCLNPKYFLKDESKCKSITEQQEPSWDSLIAQNPPEIVSLNMFIRRRNEERRLHAEEMERRRKASAVLDRKAVTRSASVGRRSLAVVEGKEKRLIETSSFIRNLALPDVDAAINADSELFHRQSKSQNGEKAWRRLAEAFASPDGKFRAKTAKRSEFVEAILRKSPFTPKTPASQMVDVENKREKRREHIEHLSQSLHESLRQRQLDASRRKDDIEHRRELDRKRLEMSIAHKDQRRTAIRLMQKEVRS